MQGTSKVTCVRLSFPSRKTVPKLFARQLVSRSDRRMERLPLKTDKIDYR